MSIAPQSPGSRPSASSSPFAAPSTSTAPSTRVHTFRPRAGMLRLFQQWLRYLSTPALLQLLLGATWLCALLFWIAAYIGIGVHRKGLQSIGRDAGIGIIQTRRLKTALLNMDASVVRLLLIPANQQNRPAARDAQQDYVTHREALGVALIDAAATMTEGQRERDALIKLHNESGRYTSLVEHALRPDSADHKAYPAARQKLKSVLLPTAGSLCILKNASFEASYAAQESPQDLTLCGVIFFGVLLIATLFTTQRVLFQRTRRLFNPGLGAATLLSVGLCWWIAASFGNAAGNLRVAKQDGFDALDALEKARAVAQDAKSDEGFWLLLPNGSPARRETSATFEAKLQEIHRILRNQFSDGNYYYSEYEDDQDSPHHTLSQLRHYHNVHSNLTGYAKAGSHELAIESYIGFYPQTDSSAFGAFAAFDSALTNDENSSQQTFKVALDQGFQQLENGEFLVSLLILAIAASTLVGIAPRLKEYSV